MFLLFYSDTVTLSFLYTVTLSFLHTVTLIHCHILRIMFCHILTLIHSFSLTLVHFHTLLQSHTLTLTLLPSPGLLTDCWKCCYSLQVQSMESLGTEWTAAGMLSSHSLPLTATGNSTVTLPLLSSILSYILSVLH
jgi:hypothetical protein